MKITFTAILVLSLFLLQAAPKFISNHENLHRFQKSPWKYMTKFAIAPQRGDFKARVQFNKPNIKGSLPDKFNLMLYIYLDEEWDKVRQLENCQEKAALARLSKPIEIPIDGSWSQEISGELTQSLRTHVWFFVIADCDRQIPSHLQATRIQWELEVFNSDGSHFSQEEHGMISPLLIVMTVIIGFFISNSIKFIKFYKTEETIDYPTLIITIALCLEFLSLVCEVLHLWIYSNDGKGSFFFNFSNQALSITSQFLITCLLLLMAYGWSINFLEFEDMDIFIPLGILLGIVHILIVGVGRITDDEYYRYHDYENWAGIFVMIMRILLFVFWVYLFKGTYATAKETEKTFFNQLGVLSTLYFLAVPVMVLFATMVVAPYWRHRVVTIGTLLLQTVTLVIFTLLFTTKQNKYYQISMKGKTILPSNKLM